MGRGVLIWNFLCTYYDALPIKQKHITSLSCFWFAEVSTRSYRLSKWFPTQCHVTLEVWGITALGGYLAWFSDWIHQQVWEIFYQFHSATILTLGWLEKWDCKWRTLTWCHGQTITLVYIGCTAAVLRREVKLVKGITSNAKTGFAIYKSILILFFLICWHIVWCQWRNWIVLLKPEWHIPRLFSRYLFCNCNDFILVMQYTFSLNSLT